MHARTRWTQGGLVVLLILTGCQDPNNPAGPDQERQSASDPDNPATAKAIEASTFMAAGRLHESQGRLVEAARQYQNAVKLTPNDPNALNRLGVVLDRMDKGDLAEKTFLKAIQVAPKNPHLYNNLAFSHILRRQWGDAEKQLHQAIALAPGFARARVNLGMVLAQQDQFDEALAEFEHALPRQDAFYNLGLMYQSKRRPVDAAEAFKAALEIDPKLTAAQEQLKRLPLEVLSEAESRLKEKQAKAAELAQAAKIADATQALQERTEASTSQPAAASALGAVDPQADKNEVMLLAAEEDFPSYDAGPTASGLTVHPKTLKSHRRDAGATRVLGRTLNTGNEPDLLALLPEAFTGPLHQVYATMAGIPTPDQADAADTTPTHRPWPLALLTRGMKKQVHAPFDLPFDLDALTNLAFSLDSRTISDWPVEAREAWQESPGPQLGPGSDPTSVPDLPPPLSSPPEP